MTDKPAPKLSLYANLLDPKGTATLSSAPVVYSQAEQDERAAKVEAAKKQISAGRA
jgi:hypothetical protein